MANLKVAWTYHTGDVSDGTTFNFRSTFECTPLLVDGVMYLTTPLLLLSRRSRSGNRESRSGRTIRNWIKDRPYNLFINRGPAFWKKGQDKRVILGTLDGRLIELNAADGKPVDSFGDKGTVDFAKDTANDFPRRLNGMTSPALIYHDLIITGSITSDSEPRGPSGDVRAF